MVPFFSLARTSLSSSGGSVYLPTLSFAWDFGNYAQAFSAYRDQIFRSFTYCAHRDGGVSAAGLFRWPT